MLFNKQQTVIQLFTEAKILEALDHPNIIRLKEFYKTESNNLILILEHCEQGDLNVFTEKRENNLISEELITSLFKRMDSSNVSSPKILP